MVVVNYHHGFHHHDAFNSQGVPGIIYWRGEEAVTNYLLMAPAAEVLIIMIIMIIMIGMIKISLNQW